MHTHTKGACLGGVLCKSPTKRQGCHVIFAHQPRTALCVLDQNRSQGSGSERQAGSYHADLQPPVGRREEERGDVVGVRELQQPVSEARFVPANRNHAGVGRSGLFGPESNNMDRRLGCR